MRTLFRWLGRLVLVVALVVGGVLIAARFSDGPLEIVAGGPFTSGELVLGAEPDWSFAKDINTVAFQLLDPARSRTTWIIEHEGRIFIPCGYMDTAWGRFWKRWPIQALDQPDAILRIDGKLYERTLVRITEGDILPPVLAELGRKYVGGEVPVAGVTSGSLWIFELAPRQT